MIKDYYIFQLVDSEYTDFDYRDELCFSKVRDLDYEYHFDDYDENDEPIYEEAIRLSSNERWYSISIRKADVEKYNLLKFKVEYYKNGNIKKCITKGGRKFRFLSTSKTRKNDRKRTKRVARKKRH